LEDQPVWAYRGYIRVGSTEWASYGCNGEGKRAVVRTQGTSGQWSTKGRLENSNTQGGFNNYVSLAGERFAPHAWDDINVPNQGSSPNSLSSSITKLMFRYAQLFSHLEKVGSQREITTGRLASI